MIGLEAIEKNTLIIDALRSERILTVRAGSNVVRILPPLNVKKKELKIALSIIRKVCEKYNWLWKIL